MDARRLTNDQASITGRKLLLVAVAAMILCGCQIGGKAQSIRRSEPAMSMSVDRDTLVNRLNQQNAGLNGWRSMETTLHVRMPKLPPQRLTGYIACKSPQYFRLTADNFVAEADLGSNASKCWAYVKPGDGVLLTWDHEDTGLVQQLPLGVPYIDPNWLMMVLGITPLDATEYQLGPAPSGKPELWLTAIEQNPRGQMMKRIIKVDTLEGVVREHALYDERNNPIVRAVLSSHQMHAGHLVPGRVKLLFPIMKAELTLSFRDVETNPMLPDDLWHMPGQDNHNIEVVDLGLIARQRLLADGQRIQQTALARPIDDVSAFPMPGPSGKNTAGEDTAGEDIQEISAPATEDNLVVAPEWDEPEPARRTIFARLFGR